MNMNSDNWLLRKGGYDDCGITSVGGAALKLAAENDLGAEVEPEKMQPEKVGPEKVTAIKSDEDV